jgi:thioredoxin reductase (NADPH)
MSAPESLPVLVVGAGPAGVSAALWLHNFDVPFDWVDATGEVGGALRRVHNEIANFPGGTFDDGRDLCATFKTHLSALELAPSPREIIALRPGDNGAPSVALTAEGGGFEARRIIVATGTTYRRLHIPGEAEGMGDYVSQSAAGDAPRFANRTVAVVGGGDAAFENALILADYGCDVTLLVRNHTYRARPAFVDAVRTHPSIHIDPRPSVVTRIEATQSGCRLYVDHGGETSTRQVAALFIRIGVDPQLPQGCERLKKDDAGFLIVDDRGRTSHPSLFAAGDVTSTPLRSVITAAGCGAHAAKACAEDLGII